MGNCMYCGKPAGFLRSHHPQCRARRESSLNLFALQCEQYLTGASNPASASPDDLSQPSYISESEYKSSVINAITKRIELLSASGTISKEDAERIEQLASANGVSLADCGEAKTELDKAYILRVLDEGNFPTVRVVGNNPIHLQKDDSIIWNFENASLLEVKKHVNYVGGSRGLSIRITRGVYYRIGAFKSHPVVHKNLEKTARGDLTICSKNLYFTSGIKSIRISLAKIISVNLYKDGIEVFRDSSNGRPLVFKIGDPHFAANILSRLT